MKRLLLMLPLLALAGCKDPKDGVKVTVTYESFVPACVRVKVQNGEDSGDIRSTDVAVFGTDKASKRQIVVGIQVPDSWGPELKVTADGHERSPNGNECDGNLVATHTEGVNLKADSVGKDRPHELTLGLTATDADGDGYVSSSNGTDCDDARASTFPGAAKRCDVEDNDCNGKSDAQELGINQDCTGKTGCSGTLICNTGTGEASCNSPDPLMAWADEDEDEHGDMNQPAIPICADSLPAKRIPTSAPHDDCDDTRPNVHPGLAEVCDGLDNNCDGPADNLPRKDCDTPVSLCAGVEVCADTQGNTKCEPLNPVPTWHPDEDGDGQGSSAVTVATCQPPEGYIQDGRDCDDGNRFRYFGADELCDEQDNDCDMVVDNPDPPDCATPPQWVSQKVGPTDPEQIWNAISLFDNGGVWVVGENSARAVKKPGVMDFDFHNDKCTDGTSVQRLLSVWAHPTTGDAYIGRDAGQLIYLTQSNMLCTSRTPVSPSDTDVTGLMGFAAADGVKVFGVGQKTPHGNTFLWDGLASSVSATQKNNTPFSAIHGLSEDLLFAVGAENSQSAIYQYKPATTSWDKVSGVPNIGVLKAVHVVNNKLAYAVSATAKLLKWDGNTWTEVTGVPVPANNPKSFSGVLAFGSNSIYITSEDGSLLRFNGNSWTVQNLFVSLYGIAGTQPDDIWLVGRYSNVFHYPAWPQ